MFQKKLQEKDAAAQRRPRLSTVAAYLDYRLDGFSNRQALARLEATAGAGRGELLGNLIDVAEAAPEVSRKS